MSDGSSGGAARLGRVRAAVGGEHRRGVCPLALPGLAMPVVFGAWIRGHCSRGWRGREVRGCRGAGRRRGRRRRPRRWRTRCRGWRYRWSWAPRDPCGRRQASPQWACHYCRYGRRADHPRCNGRRGQRDRFDLDRRGRSGAERHLRIGRERRHWPPASDDLGDEDSHRHDDGHARNGVVQGHRLSVHVHRGVHPQRPSPARSFIPDTGGR
jgi:hypothetical protein